MSELGVPTSKLGLAVYGGSQLLNGLLTLFGMDAQAEENRRTRNANQEMFNTQLGMEREQFGQQMALGIRQQDFSEASTKWNQKMTEEQVARDKEKENYTRQAQLMNGFTAMLNSRPQIRQNLIQSWRAL